jgi:hypothetical protein
MRSKTLLLIFSLILFTGCSYEKMLDKLEPKEESAFAKTYLEKLRQRNIAGIKEHLSSELLTPDADSKLTEVANYFPEGEPVAIKLIGANVFKSSSAWQANLTYQYQFKSEWAVANIVLSRENGILIVKGIHVNRLAQSLEEANAFTLSNKSTIHYLFLFCAVAIPLFILYSLILCIRTPIEKRKWLWVIFILLGFVGISLNWTTGQVSVNLIQFQLLGAAALAASPYAPWIITMSVPLGAIIFLFKRKSLMKREVITINEN